MYNLTFLVTVPIFIISALLFIFSMVKIAQKSPGARNMMSLGFGIWLVGVVVGSLVFLFA